MEQFNIKQRIELDKFYTNEEIIYNIIKEIKHVNEDKYKDYLFIEPSAGDGALLRTMDKLNLKYEAFDLAPEREGITQQDFLQFNSEKYQDKKVITFMNPPFGVNAGLVKKFFNKASEFSDEIWIIAPRSIKREGIKSKLNPYFKMVTCVDLPKNSFLLNGKPYDVPCCFSIWVKTDEKQDYDVRTKSELFEIVKDPAQADLVVIRSGGRTGQLVEAGKIVASNVRYIKILKDHDKVVEAFETMDYQKIANENAGQRSLNRSEIIKLVEEAYSKII